MKKVKHVLKRIRFVRWIYFIIVFIYKNKYIPNFKKPKTYNEKVNYRKNNFKNEMFSLCSDKIAAKEWVKAQIGSKYIIPNYFVGDTITVEKIKEIIKENGGCFLKANHNSGPVQLLTKQSTEIELEEACREIMEQLSVDFGELVNEPWYSEIKPRVLVEKRLAAEAGESDIRDYKFHVFKQEEGRVKIFVAIDFDRNENHSRSFFDEHFNYMHLSSHVPSVITSLAKPKNYDEMLLLAKKLARPFSYVRVDFYNVGGEIYFGEMTFAPGSGFLDFFESYQYDLWVGNLWRGDPRY